MICRLSPCLLSYLQIYMKYIPKKLIKSYFFSNTNKIDDLGLKLSKLYSMGNDKDARTFYSQVTKKADTE